jgi:hypothetical protein
MQTSKVHCEVLLRGGAAELLQLHLHLPIQRDGRVIRLLLVDGSMANRSACTRERQRGPYLSLIGDRYDMTSIASTRIQNTAFGRKIGEVEAKALLNRCCMFSRGKDIDVCESPSSPCPLLSNLNVPVPSDRSSIRFRLQVGSISTVYIHQTSSERY